MAKPVALPLTISVLLHLAVVVLLAFNLTFSALPQVVQQPKIIEAKLVSMEQLSALRAKPKPMTEAEPKPVDAPKPEPKEPEPVKLEPPKPEPKPQPPKPDVEKQKQIEKQKLLEKERASLEQKKLDEQKKLAEQKKKESERRRIEAEELQRKQRQEELARKQQQEKAELAKAMAAEDNAMAAERDQEAVASFAGLIQRDIQNNWSRPPSARIGMHVVLLIQLIPSGDVINVSVLKSSGNDAFDRSAQDAVRRVGKFPYLKELDKTPQVFERNFRRLQLDFSPEDLRQ